MALSTRSVLCPPSLRLCNVKKSLLPRPPLHSPCHLRKTSRSKRRQRMMRVLQNLRLLLSLTKILASDSLGLCQVDVMDERVATTRFVGVSHASMEATTASCTTRSMLKGARRPFLVWEQSLHLPLLWCLPAQSLSPSRPLTKTGVLLHPMVRFAAKRPPHGERPVPMWRLEVPTLAPNIATCMPTLILILLLEGTKVP